MSIIANDGLAPDDSCTNLIPSHGNSGRQRGDAENAGQENAAPCRKSMEHCSVLTVLYVYI